MEPILRSIEEDKYMRTKKMQDEYQLKNNDMKRFENIQQ
jgi:hypothetical protein